VQYIGHRGPNGEFSPARDCHEWRRQLRAGHYDYVVLRDEREPIDRERAWLEEDPAAGAPVRAGGALVFTYDAAKSTSCS